MVVDKPLQTVVVKKLYDYNKWERERGRERERERKREREREKEREGERDTHTQTGREMERNVCINQD